MKLPNMFKKSTTTEDEYDEAENVVKHLFNEKQNRIPTCKFEDDKFFAQYQLNMTNAIKTRDNLLVELEYVTYCKINSFPLYTPCTLETMAKRCGVPWWRAKRIMIMEIMECPLDIINIIKILVHGRVATTTTYKHEHKTSILILPNFRFVESSNHGTYYIERIE